jgi:hypothetical protein
MGEGRLALRSRLQQLHHRLGRIAQPRLPHQCGLLTEATCEVLVEAASGVLVTSATSLALPPVANLWHCRQLLTSEAGAAISAAVPHNSLQYLFCCGVRPRTKSVRDDCS